MIQDTTFPEQSGSELAYVKRSILSFFVRVAVFFGIAFMMESGLNAHSPFIFMVTGYFLFPIQNAVARAIRGNP